MQGGTNLSLRRPTGSVRGKHYQALLTDRVDELCLLDEEHIELITLSALIFYAHAASRNPLFALAALRDSSAALQQIIGNTKKVVMQAPFAIIAMY